MRLASVVSVGLHINSRVFFTWEPMVHSICITRKERLIPLKRCQVYSLARHEKSSTGSMCAICSIEEKPIWWCWRFIMKKLITIKRDIDKQCTSQQGLNISLWIIYNRMWFYNYGVLDLRNGSNVKWVIFI